MAHVVVVGCGNIGSHLVSHLGRLPTVDKVTLIDHDHYEARNLTSQDIWPSDVGSSKSRVQAARLRRLNPNLQVKPIASTVQDVPLGNLRCDLMLSCLDSRVARMYVNQAAWRLGLPWIDSGLDPLQLLVRINPYLPRPDQPCLECAWSEQDYESLEILHPCLGFVDSHGATNGPSGLGALAASLQVVEAQKILAGRFDEAAFGRQVLLDAAHHKHYLTSFRRNPHCRFDHAIWRIEDLDARRVRNLGDALALTGDATLEKPPAWLQIEGKPFVQGLDCYSCGNRKSLIRLQCSLKTRETRCPRCGESMSATGWNLTDRLSSELPKKVLSRSLSTLGLRSGDVVTIGHAGGKRHFKITVINGDSQIPSSGEIQE
jgi:adenylyltransferase/sulfurtransferase